MKDLYKGCDVEQALEKVWFSCFPDSDTERQMYDALWQCALSFTVAGTLKDWLPIFKALRWSYAKGYSDCAHSVRGEGGELEYSRSDGDGD